MLPQSRKAEMAHPNCHGPEGHVCALPSGRECRKQGCGEPAGTRWSSLWCPGCDEERLDQIAANLDAMTAAYAARNILCECGIQRRYHAEDGTIQSNPWSAEKCDGFVPAGTEGDP